MKKNGLLLISIMAFAMLPLVITNQVSGFHLVDGYDLSGVIPYKGKPGGGGGTPTPQVADWGYMRVNADGARAATSGSVIVAVLDTGVDSKHADLQGVLVSCFSGIKRADYACDDRNVKDDDGHGTHVAGTIAALDNTQDSVGVASGHVQIISGKVLGRRGGDWADLSWAIMHATDLGANVITMSLGGDISSSQSTIDMLQNAIDYAYNRGVAIVAAAGNEGDATCSATDTEPSWPAMNNNVIAVGATGLHDGTNFVTEWTGAEDDVFPCFSNSGSYVDISAPGVYITASAAGGGVTDLSGTSMAAPHVAAMLVLLMAQGMSNVQAENYILNNAIDLGYPATLQGAGLMQY